MPVLLDRGHSRSVILGARSEISAADFTSSRFIDIALINNMPDSALESTERQFAELVAAASGNALVRLRVFALDEVWRSSPAQRYIDENYSAIENLWTDPPDGLIVTGAEPRAATLTDEPYWGALVQVMHWAQDTTISTIWSCLAAHAAVLHIDGIQRRPLPEKRSGVFQCNRVSDHPLVAGLPRRFETPHSRCNDLGHHELAAAGYTILSTAEQAGVDAFVKKMRSTFVFFQGHPEYEAGTLFREYRRDVARYLNGERKSYPAMPERYFAHNARARFMAFRESALAARSDTLLAEFPLAPGLTDTWRVAATDIYRNWLNLISTEKRQQRNPVRGTLSRKVALVASAGYRTDRN